MSSILSICADPDAAAAVEQAAAERGCRVRTVSTIAAGIEWIGLQQFELVLVHEGIKAEDSIRFLEAAWKANPLTEGAIFNFQQPLENPWEAILIGANVFSGPDGIEAFKDLLDGIPKSISAENLDQLGVLVVDDLDAPRDILCSYIQALGFQHTFGVGSVDEALAELRKNGKKYFCVLSDISMPLKSGINLLQEIRAIDGLGTIPVVVCTAHPTGENLVRSIVAGATGFIVKPPRKALLRSELDKAKRFFRLGKDPRLCPADLAPKFEDAMRRRGLI